MASYLTSSVAEASLFLAFLQAFFTWFLVTTRNLKFPAFCVPTSPAWHFRLLVALVLCVLVLLTESNNFLQTEPVSDTPTQPARNFGMAKDANSVPVHSILDLDNPVEFNTIHSNSNPPESTLWKCYPSMSLYFSGLRNTMAITFLTFCPGTDFGQLRSRHQLGHHWGACRTWCFPCLQQKEPWV